VLGYSTSVSEEPKATPPPLPARARASGRPAPSVSPSVPPPTPSVEPATTESAAASPRGGPLGVVGGYDLLVELAAGGMAMVFLARANDGRAVAPLVAIKRPHRHLAADKTFLSMLLDEARLASAIHHDNVVKVRELGFHAGEPFIVLDYVEGASLSELRKELAAAERAVDTKVALRIVLDALAGLHAAHELRDETGRPLGIIHRDVSPHNVLIGCDGRARLTDFGIAKAEDRLQVTRTNEVKGKLAYLAPERVDKRRICTKQSDVFSMAVVLWECLAGRRLFRGDEAVDTLQEVMHAPIPRLRQLGAQIPPSLDDVLARGLSRDLSVRFASAQDFADAIVRGAGRGNLGTPRDVARTIEAIFGLRMAKRHEVIREAVGDDVMATTLFDVSGIPNRPKPQGTASHSPLALLAAISPPAPSERYSFGKASEDYGRIAEKRARRNVAAGVAVGVAVGVMVALLVLARPRGEAAAPVDPAPIQAIAPPSPPMAEPEPIPRRVVVPLPFLATHAELDDLVRDVEPPADAVVFTLPRESGVSHHVIATALDGTRAEAFVRESEGIARAEGDGFLVLSPPTSATSLPKVHPPQRRAPAGRVKDGFTTLP
jgi:eukaryotic-like serine/threonine-protein kinase